MFEVTVDSRIINAKLGAMTGNVKESLKRAVYTKAIDLQRYIIQEKLHAPPGYSPDQLHIVTAKLRNSIQKEVTVTDTSVRGTVFSGGNVPYARIHEYGGTITRYGSKVGDYTVRIPARPYMRSSLSENKEAIVDAMKEAVTQGVREK